MAQYEHQESENRSFLFCLEEGSLPRHFSHYSNMSPPRDCRYIWKSFFAIYYIHIHTYYPSITLVWITDLATGHARSKTGEWVWFCFRFHWLRI